MQKVNDRIQREPYIKYSYTFNKFGLLTIKKKICFNAVSVSETLELTIICLKKKVLWKKLSIYKVSIVIRGFSNGTTVKDMYDVILGKKNVYSIFQYFC